VRSVERQPILSESAGLRLASAGFGDEVELVCADGLSGEPGEERYDRIILNGVVLGVPSAVTSQLAPGGLLVGATATEALPRLHVIRRNRDGSLVHTVGASLRLSPLVASHVIKLKTGGRNGSLT
jgi:protein-L-isoaspartate O-methyltransferase